MLVRRGRCFGHYVIYTMLVFGCVQHGYGYLALSYPIRAQLPHLMMVSCELFLLSSENHRQALRVKSATS